MESIKEKLSLSWLWFTTWHTSTIVSLISCFTASSPINKQGPFKFMAVKGTGHPKWREVREGKNQGLDSDEKRFLQRLLHTPSKCQLYKRGLHKAVGCTVLAAKSVRIWWIRFIQTSQVRHTRQDLTQVRASSKTRSWHVSCKVSWSFCAPRRLKTHSLRRQLHLLVSGTSWSDIVQPMGHLLATPAQNWEDLDSETLQTPCVPMHCRFCTCYLQTHNYIRRIFPSALCISALRQSAHLFPSPHLAFPGAPWELLGFALSTCAAQSHVITSRKLNNTHHT